MSNHQMLKVMINDRLSVAAQEIFALFVKTVTDYQKEIERLKKAIEPKRIQVVLGPKLILEKHVDQEELADPVVNQDHEEPFQCKEEREPVVITRADQPQMLITNVKSLSGDELVPHGQQHNATRDVPEEQATDNSSSESRSKPEERVLATGSEGRSVRRDLPKKTLSCSVCKTRFAYNRSLRRHMRSLHTDSSSAEFNAQLDNGQHSGSTEAGPFSCTVCHRAFNQLYSLNLHMRRHAGENPYNCTECSVPFTNESHFSRHMRTVHSVEKPFECSVCKKCFKTSYAQSVHTLLHTGERPFKCSVCGKGFIQKVSLKNHMPSHAVSCPECGKKCISRQSLMIHVRLSHP